jgi:hypothetical protein
MTQAQPEKQPISPLREPDERLAEIRAKSIERYDAYDSDTRWLLRYVDMLLKDNGQLRRRRTSFEHKMFTVVILVVGIAMIGAIAYNIYIQPQQELFPGCTYSTPHSCTAWIWDYAEPLLEHPH